MRENAISKQKESPPLEFRGPHGETTVRAPSRYALYSPSLQLPHILSLSFPLSPAPPPSPLNFSVFLSLPIYIHDQTSA